jgi:hypothetical protein
MGVMEGGEGGLLVGLLLLLLLRGVVVVVVVVIMVQVGVVVQGILQRGVVRMQKRRHLVGVGGMPVP